jgi:hypothetical protein
MHWNWEDLIEEFHQLYCRQFALIIDSLKSIFIQIRIVRDLASSGDEVPITSSELRLKLEKLQAELSELFAIINVMKTLNNNNLK